MKEFLCQWWPLLALILLGLLTSILWDIERKKDVATSLGRFPDDPDDVMDRLEYKGREYVKMWPSGACFTEEFYNHMRPNNKKKIDMKPDKIYLPWEYAEIDVLPPGVTTKQVFGKDVCYVRKDYLLKWAKERYQQTISNVGCYTGHSVWAEVIEKLESL